MKATLIVIQDEADHAEAKRLVSKLMGSTDPRDRARLQAQARLIEAYERAKWPRAAPSLPAFSATCWISTVCPRADLVPLLGTPSRVSEVLSGKRDLSMTMVRRLRERFHVSGGPAGIAGSGTQQDGRLARVSAQASRRLPVRQYHHLRDDVRDLAAAEPEQIGMEC